MSKRTSLLASDVFAEWQKNPEFVAAYDALEEEFALAEALIRAGAAAEMTPEDVAKAMGTAQAAIARLESGRSMPSTRTLQRSADAAGTKLRIHFERPRSAAAITDTPLPNMPAAKTPEPKMPAPDTRPSRSSKSIAQSPVSKAR